MNITDLNSISRDFKLESDLANQCPLYVYHHQNYLYSSTNLVGLLEYLKEQFTLTVRQKSITQLLSDGVVQTPNTVFSNFYILGIGDFLFVECENGDFHLKFGNKFPFDLNPLEPHVPSYDQLLELLADSFTAQMISSKDTFLFHSAGKDSNSIALALAQGGYNQKVTLVNYKTTDSKDESTISRNLSEKMGFRHMVLDLSYNLNAASENNLYSYFENCPLPCLDNVTAAYPLFGIEKPALLDANLIDGGGNDSYFHCPVENSEYYKFLVAKMTPFRRYLNNNSKSETKLYSATKSSIQLSGLSGFSKYDISMIMKFPQFNTDFGPGLGFGLKKIDVDYFRSVQYTSKVISEMHIRKFRNFCDTSLSVGILPFADSAVASLMNNLPLHKKFVGSRNKIFLRELLQAKIGLDSDGIGKHGFNYDSMRLMLFNEKIVRGTISSCLTYDTNGVSTLVDRLYNNIKRGNSRSSISSRKLVRVFLLALWLNNSKYIAR